MSIIRFPVLCIAGRVVRGSRWKWLVVHVWFEWGDILQTRLLCYTMVEGHWSWPCVTLVCRHVVIESHEALLFYNYSTIFLLLFLLWTEDPQILRVQTTRWYYLRLTRKSAFATRHWLQLISMTSIWQAITIIFSIKIQLALFNHSPWH